jgi:hypothetical protein
VLAREARSRQLHAYASRAARNAEIMIDPDGQRSLVLAPARYVLLPLANLITGYSVKAMERKIERGDWQEGKVWRRAPDGRILIDVVGYQRWVEHDYRG